MQALIIAVLLIGCCVGAAAVGRASALRTNRRAELTKQDRDELVALRELRDELLSQAIDRVELEPFAVVTIDTIRTHQKRISS